MIIFILVDNGSRKDILHGQYPQFKFTGNGLLLLTPQPFEDGSLLDMSALHYPAGSYIKGFK